MYQYKNSYKKIVRLDTKIADLFKSLSTGRRRTKSNKIKLGLLKREYQDLKIKNPRYFKNRHNYPSTFLALTKKIYY